MIQTLPTTPNPIPIFAPVVRAEVLRGVGELEEAGLSGILDVLMEVLAAAVDTKVSGPAFGAIKTGVVGTVRA